MDKTLIWLLVPGTLMIFYYLRVSAGYKHLSYDLEEYMLAGKRVRSRRFVLATTTATLLGMMALPHMGLFYRSGFTYGFAALGAIIIPLVSALFARRMWTLGRIYNPLTPGQLLGEYYRSNGVRVLSAIVAILVTLPLLIMSLRLGANLIEGLLAGYISPDKGAGFGKFTGPLVMYALTGILFYHTAFGGMGAVLRIAAVAGIALVIALIAAALISINALGGISGFLDHFSRLQADQLSSPFFVEGAFYDPIPAAAPANMAWPGIMIASCLVAIAGLAITPMTLMLGFTPAKGQSHAPQQFIAAALISGFLLLTTTIIIALLARLAGELPGFAADQLNAVIGPVKTGSEPQIIIFTLLSTPLGAPLVMVLITLALIAGLLSSSAALLMTTGAMVANDIFYERLKRANRPTYRISITRTAIATLLAIALAIALANPDDPLPLFLLAGAFGLQLLPAIIGLCYFPGLSARAVLDGAIAGLLGVIVTSSLPQTISKMLDVALPFGAWPFSVHPALWGLGANLALLLLTLTIERATSGGEKRKQALLHKRSYHLLPDEKPLMAPDAGLWRIIAWLLAALFIGSIGLALMGEKLPDTLLTALPALWKWQTISWLIGLALVYVVAYRLQPVFDIEQAMHGSFDPKKRRFRIKAQTRRTRSGKATSPAPRQ